MTTSNQLGPVLVSLHHVKATGSLSVGIEKKPKAFSSDLVVAKQWLESVCGKATYSATIVVGDKYDTLLLTLYDQFFKQLPTLTLVGTEFEVGAVLKFLHGIGDNPVKIVEGSVTKTLVREFGVVVRD